jgi:rhomboid family GlyGly-CTERM serine protease
VLLLPELTGEWGRAALRYERHAIAAGEWWRLVTAHLVHLDLEHAVLNALGLVLMWSLFARDFGPRQWLAIVIATFAVIDAGLWFRDPQIDWYVGASGALHGVMAAGTYAHVRRGDLDGWILAIFIVVKLIYEQWHGQLPFNESGVPVVVNAHLYGALGGLGMAAAMKPRAEPL